MKGNLGQMEKDVKYLKNLAVELRSLTVFRALKKDPVIAALLKYLDLCDGENVAESVEA